MSFSVFKVEKDQDIALVTMTSPNGLNLMGPAFWDELPVVFQELARDASVRVIVLQSDGKHFTAGLDLINVMPRLKSPEKGHVPTQRHILKTIHTWQAAISAVEECPQPVIAAIHGKCIGGGVDLITAADVRLATEDASFSVKEVKVAIVADLGTLQRLPKIVGEGVAREWAYLGEDISAQRALSTNFVNHLYPDKESVQAAALDMARRIAVNSPLAVQGTKVMMNYSRDHNLQEGLERVALWNANFVMSEDLMEAAGAFMQKREPQFKGK